MAEIIELTPPTKTTEQGQIIELTQAPESSRPDFRGADLLGRTPEEPQQQISQRKPAFLEALDDISNTFSQFTREALNTATFGLSDIVAGAGSALAEELFAGEDKDPARAFNIPREQRIFFREENPVSSGVASFVGGFVNPASGPAGAIVQRGGGLISKTLRSGGVGAGFAGGQATGEEAGEILGKAVTGQDIDLGESGERIAVSTAVGTGIGASVTPVVKTLGFLGKQGVDFLRRFSQRGQETRAFRKVAEALERDGFTPQQALERIEKLGPEAALIDAGENSRALAFTVGAGPGAGKTKITKFVRERQEGIRDPETGVIKGGQVNRIQDHIDQLVKANFFTETQRLANINNAAKLYTSAYASNQQVESKAINRILKTPSGKRAFQIARKTIQDLRTNLSKTDPELTAQLRDTGAKATGKGVGKGLKLEFLDQVKQELFDLEQVAKSQFGKATSKSRAISQLRRDFTKALDEVDVSGNYAKARLMAGDKLANQEALESGAEFLSKSKFSTPEELGIALQDMSPEARHLFRVGAAQSLKSKISEIVSRADASKKLIDIQSLERKIRLAFGDNKKFQQYIDLLENEKELFRAVTEVLGNSKTAARGAAIDDLAQDPGKVGQGIRDLLIGDFFSATKNLTGGLRGRLTQTDLESEKIAKILTGRDVRGLAGRIRRPVSPVTETGQPRGLLGRTAGSLAITTGTGLGGR